MRRPEWVLTREEMPAVLASAALFALAFPPFPPLIAAIVCLVPAAVAVARKIERGERARSSFRLGFWLGLLGYGANLYWIAIALSIYTKLSFLGYLGALLVMAPIVGATLAGLHIARRTTRWPMAILLPIAWVASELAINYLPDLGFPWLPLGLATARLPLMAQIAELSGVRGISFWIAATAGLIADMILLTDRRARTIRVGVAMGLALLVAVFGMWRLKAVRVREVAPIAIIQPNIPQQEKWQEENQQRIVGILASLTRERMAMRDAELVMWPEVALPDYFVRHPEWSDTLRALASVSNASLALGILDVEFAHASDPGEPATPQVFNAAIATDTLGALMARTPYRKEFLVPVVERVPFLNPAWFSKLKYFGGFGRGKDQEPFRFHFGSGGMLICYESIFPQLSREYRRHGADLLLNITNDAWFGRSIAPYQHEAHLALRAIENRVGIVRAANTGISAYVDPLGRFHGETQLDVAVTRTYRAETTDLRTPYVRIGDWIGVGSALAMLGILFTAGARRRRARSRTV